MVGIKSNSSEETTPDPAVLIAFGCCKCQDLLNDNYVSISSCNNPVPVVQVIHSVNRRARNTREFPIFKPKRKMNRSAEPTAEKFDRQPKDSELPKNDPLNFVSEGFLSKLIHKSAEPTRPTMDS